MCRGRPAASAEGGTRTDGQGRPQNFLECKIGHAAIRAVPGKFSGRKQEGGPLLSQRLFRGRGIPLIQCHSHKSLRPHPHRGFGRRGRRNICNGFAVVNRPAVPMQKGKGNMESQCRNRKNTGQNDRRPNAFSDFRLH